MKILHLSFNLNSTKSEVYRVKLIVCMLNYVKFNIQFSKSSHSFKLSKVHSVRICHPFKGWVNSTDSVLEGKLLFTQGLDSLFHLGLFAKTCQDYLLHVCFQHTSLLFHTAGNTIYLFIQELNDVLSLKGGFFFYTCFEIRKKYIFYVWWLLRNCLHGQGSRSTQKSGRSRIIKIETSGEDLHLVLHYSVSRQAKHSS